MRGERARALVRRLVATTVVVAAIVSVGGSPAQAAVTYSLSDSFDNPALWSNDFGTPTSNCTWGVVSTVWSLARTPPNTGVISTCTGGLGTIGRYVTIPAGSAQCVVRVWRKTNSFDLQTKTNTLHIDVIEPGTWHVLGWQLAVANLNPDSGQWRQYSTASFSVSA